MKRFFTVGFIFSALLLIFTGCPNTTGNTGEDLVTDFQSDIILFEGERDFGNWGENLRINPEDENDKDWLAFCCTGFSEGDQIQITHKKSSIYNEKICLPICGLDWSAESQLSEENSFVNVTKDSNDTIIPKTFDQTTAYTLTAKDAETLNACNGFVVYGCGICVTKVALKTNNILNVDFIKNGWALKNVDGIMDVDGEDLSFVYRFCPVYKDWEEAKLDPKMFKEFRFDYTYNSDNKKLTITKAYTVSYAEDGKEVLNEISGAKNFTASYSDSLGQFENECGIKFDLLPVKELSDFFCLNVYYPFSDKPAGGENHVEMIDDSVLQDKVYFIQQLSNQKPGDNDTDYIYFPNEKAATLVSKKDKDGYSKTDSVTIDPAVWAVKSGEVTLADLKVKNGTIHYIDYETKCTRGEGNQTGLFGAWTCTERDGYAVTVSETSITIGETTSDYSDDNGFLTIKDIAGEGNDGYGYYDGTDLYIGIGKLIEVTDSSIISNVKNVASSQP